MSVIMATPKKLNGRNSIKKKHKGKQRQNSIKEKYHRFRHLKWNTTYRKMRYGSPKDSNMKLGGISLMRSATSGEYCARTNLDLFRASAESI